MRKKEIDNMDAWLAVAQTARNEALSEGEMVSRLTEARAGSLEARRVLLAGTAYLIYAFGFEWVRLNKKKKRCLDEIIGELHGALDESIRRLAEENDRLDVLKFIDDELHRSVGDFRREESSTVYVPSSTNSARKANGEEPYRGLRRIGTCVAAAASRVDADGNHLTGRGEEPEYSGPDCDQEGEYAHRPSKYFNQRDDLAMVDLLSEFSEEEQEIIPLLVGGVPLSGIAKQTKKSLYRVRQLKSQIAAHYKSPCNGFGNLVELASEAMEPSEVRCGLSVEDAILVRDGLELVLSV